jgi:peroxin-5
MGATSDTVPAQQFDDQEALVMSDARPATQRRKSVHFDTIAEPASLGSGVPAKLSEALAHSTAISGAASRWEEQGLDDDDFGQEAFMAFNGPLQVARDVQLGVGDLEGWRELQKDWEEFQRSEPVAQGVRGMGIGDMSERYLFQSSNPYAQVGLGGAHVFDLGRESPTLRVSEASVEFSS